MGLAAGGEAGFTGCADKRMEKVLAKAIAMNIESVFLAHYGSCLEQIASAAKMTNSPLALQQVMAVEFEPTTKPKGN